ncbi:hypothetical protein IYQ92_07025 [Streptococcus sp. HF-1907]|uniref:hypothetical protein n=1 Tax=Streptococcus sp. HF-1907 TaxID=2785793 RepID=UPI0018A1212B|nr:hypothetical protein [Streptococcus sp. HF-1907]MBF7094990.1 hypothetical protein [Streptococcus sp. HF-1907]
MAIAPFDNNDYELILSDLIADIYYSDISDGSRIVLLRKLTELLARKFLDLGAGEPMNLEDITAYEKNDKFKVTEQYNKVDKRLVKDFEKTINRLRKIGNKHTHTANVLVANKDELIMAEDSIWELFSYLFVQYFLKYNLNLKSDKNVLSFFSLLPPEIRYRTLKKLVEVEGFDNIQLLDKFLLSIVKTKGIDEARFWLNSNREKIQNMDYPSEAEIIEYEEDFSQEDLPLKLRNYSDSYGLLASVINHADVRSASHGLYKNFEEVTAIYEQYNLEDYLSSSEEREKFKNLIKFCFIGRISVF